MDVFAGFDLETAFCMLDAVAKGLNQVRLPAIKPTPNITISIAVGSGDNPFSPRDRVTLDNLRFGSGVEKLA